MSAAAAKFNLRPQERRLVAFVSLVVFVVVNIAFIWPRFGDWALIKLREQRAQRTLNAYRTEIAKVKGYEVKLRELKNAGSSVVPEEQDLDLLRIVDTQRRLNNLSVASSDPRPRTSMTTQTNRFFEEQYMTLHVTSGPEELVNFLVSLTSSNSLIRVKNMMVKPDPGATKLESSLILVASYQKSAPVKTRPAATTAPQSSPPAKPVVTRTTATSNKPGVNTAAAARRNRLTSSTSRPTNQPSIRR